MTTRKPTADTDRAARVAALDTQVQQLARRLDEAGPDDVEPTDAVAPAPLFPDVESWVQAIFLPMFGWRVDGQRWYWCPQWWRHAEAIWRLELLWRSWEVSRLQPTGMSGWSVELDRHKWELLGDEGPFRQCRGPEDDRPDRHTDLPTATAQPALPGWWD